MSIVNWVLFFIMAVVLFSGGKVQANISDFTEACLTVIAVTSIVCYTWFRLQTSKAEPQKVTSPGFPKDCCVKASGVLVEEVTKKRYDLHMACLNFRHDFEMLSGDEQALIKKEAELWGEAWGKVRNS